MAPPQLPDLPTELLVEICHWALEDAEKEKKPPYHPHGWLRLGRICKRFHAIVQPFLYSHIIAGESQSPYERPRRVNLDNLLHRLWTNPALGLLVRHVVLDASPHHRPKSQLVQGGVDRRRTYLYMAVKHHLGMDLPESSFPIPPTMAHWCWESAVPLFLLLSMAPNVRSVDIHVHCESEVHLGLAQRLPNGTFVPMVTFPNLTSLRLWSRSSVKRSMPPGCRCRDAVAFFFAAAPNLTSLEPSGFGVLNYGLRLPPQLVSFVLINTHYASGSDLDDMARRVPGLKRFYIMPDRGRLIAPRHHYYVSSF
ncbi:hypothetical protein B0I37DRAFT_239372 [Chaetomium sp. MPI-CAGE-AT-0009]|nr:hypothetical protein B0I37DRAFT_239372 [Chaetomium sp. MPI-CAGE-AT-0009]